MEQDKEKIDEFVNSCISGMTLISRSWNGDDANYSIEKINNYINELKKVSVAYNDISKFIKYASEEYYKKDNSFYDKFNNERNSYESEFNEI